MKSNVQQFAQRKALPHPWFFEKISNIWLKGNTTQDTTTKHCPRNLSMLNTPTHHLPLVTHLQKNSSMFAFNFPTSFLKKALILIVILLQNFGSWGNCPPYKIPTVPAPTDYQKIVYIDPSASTNGNGTIQSPYNTFNGIGSGYTIPANTAYLIKRGTTLRERIRKVFNNNYIGAYGEGAKPIVLGGIRLVSNTYNITINDLNIRTASLNEGGNDAIIFGEDTNVSNVFISNNYITGLFDASKTYKYPYRAIKGKNNNWTIYNNVISYVYDDGIGMGNGDNYIIVRNYIHNVDMKRVGNEYTRDTPGAKSNGSEFNYDCGDGIHLNQHNNIYIAGNLVDRSNTSWKFALIFKTHWESTKKGAVVEYNTFIGNNGGPGGGTVAYFEGSKESTFRKNVFDATNYGKQTGPTIIYDVSGSGNIVRQSQPYGFYDNHLIRGNTSRSFYEPSSVMSIIEKTNGLFTGYATYQTYLKNNPNIGLYGSDIDPNNFWAPLCQTAQSYKVNFSIKNSAGSNITNATVTLGTRKNAAGDYTFSNVAAGNYSYKIEAQGYTTISVNSVTVNKDLNISAVLNPVQEATYTVNFKVTNASGATINNAVITFNGVTNAAGNYSFTNVKSGTYTYSVEAPNFVKISNQSVSISANRQIDVVMSAVSAPTYTVSFIVKDGTSNTNITNAVITFNGKTNNAGNYVFQNVPEGSYSYSIAADGYKNMQTQTVSVNKNTSVTVTMNPNDVKKVRINTSSNPSQAAIISGGGEYNEGDKVTLFFAASGNEYKFEGWEENQKVISKQTSLSFNASQDRNIIARFSINRRKFSIKASLSLSEGGTINGAGTYEEGQTAVLEVSPKENYSFVGWANETGQIISKQNPLTINVESNMELVAVVETQKKIKVYPNPSNGFMHFSNTYPEDAELKVFNNRGVIMTSQRIQAHSNTIDLTSLPTGLYFLQFNFEKETITQRVIIK